MQDTSLVKGVSAVRAAVGVALALATRPLLRSTVRREPLTGPLVLFARTVGIRDFVFGAGSLAAAMKPDADSDVGRWLTAWAVSDVADVVAALTARDIDRSGALAAAAAPLPLLAAGMWALRRQRG